MYIGCALSYGCLKHRLNKLNDRRIVYVLIFDIGSRRVKSDLCGMLFLELCGSRPCLLFTVSSVELQRYLRTRAEERNDFHIRHYRYVVDRHDVHGIGHRNL